MQVCRVEMDGLNNTNMCSQEELGKRFDGAKDYTKKLQGDENAEC